MLLPHEPVSDRVRLSVIPNLLLGITGTFGAKKHSFLSFQEKKNVQNLLPLLCLARKDCLES